MRGAGNDCHDARERIRAVVLRGDEADGLVRGGHFTEFRRVLFVGSIADSGSFHPRIIDIALRMQFICGDQLVTTSAVQSLSRHPSSTTSTESASAL